MASVSLPRFVRAALSEDGSAAPPPPAGGGRVLLVPLRTLSLRPFRFPFSGGQKVRDALRLGLKPLFGDVEPVLVIQTLAREGRGCSGIAWIASREEAASVPLAPGDRLLPLPAALASEAGADGSAVWIEETGAFGLVRSGGSPVLAFSLPVGTGEPEARAFLEAWGRASGLPVGDLRLLDGRGPDGAARLEAAAAESWRTLPWVRELDLSPTGAAALERQGRRERLLGRSAGALMLLGILSTGLFGLRWALAVRTAEASRAAAAALYSEVFGAPAADPVGSARRAVAALRRAGGGSDPIGRLAPVARAFGDPRFSALRLESLRSNEEGLQLVGTSPGVEAIQDLKGRLSFPGAPARLGEVQQIPGGGYRFTLTLSGGGAPR